jgi:hypothetical protein
MEHTTPNDYTLEAKRLPARVTEQEVMNIFSRLPNGRTAQIEKVNFAYKIGDFIQALQSKALNEKHQELAVVDQ